MSSLYVDGCCNKSIGACSSVVDHDHNDVIGPNLTFLKTVDFLNEFRIKPHTVKGRKRMIYEVGFTDVVSQQNNGAELVAMCIGLILAIEYDYKRIYSDSKLLIDHWTRKPSLKIEDPFKRQIQHLVVELRADFVNRGGQVLYVPGDSNPADLGYHR
jgi:hypothetical protein